MTIENFKRLGVLLITVFAMTAVYELAVIPKTQDDYPLFFVYESYEEKGLGLVPCLELQRTCTCYIKVSPNSKNYKTLSKILSNKDYDSSGFYHAEKVSLYAYRGNERARRIDMNEEWMILETGNTEYYTQDNNRVNFFSLSEEQLEIFKNTLEQYTTGTMGTCPPGEINYPSITTRQKYDDELNNRIEDHKIWQSRQLRKWIDKPNYINPASGDDGSA